MTTHHALTPLAALAAGIAIAACGSSSTGSTSADAVSSSSAAPSSSAKASSMIPFSSCMRASGVPNFPDLTPGSPLRVQSGPNGTEVNGVAVNGPAFQAAQQKCRSKLPGGGQPPSGAAPPAVQHAALNYAKCMRSHGVPNFPDPKVSGSSGKIAIQIGGQGIDPNAPAFKSAQQTCQPLLRAVLPKGAGAKAGP